MDGIPLQEQLICPPPLPCLQPQQGADQRGDNGGARASACPHPQSPLLARPMCTVGVDRRPVQLGDGASSTWHHDLPLRAACPMVAAAAHTADLGNSLCHPCHGHPLLLPSVRHGHWWAASPWVTAPSHDFLPCGIPYTDCTANDLEWGGDLAGGAKGGLHPRFSH